MLHPRVKPTIAHKFTRTFTPKRLSKSETTAVGEG